jgi:hypothetical protein
MAEQASERTKFPQIPSTVWWGVRAILNRSPNSVIDERLLAIELTVQEVAAKAYVAELVAVGILNEDKRATPLALKWRLEEKYQEAVESTYPESLRSMAPPETGERSKAISWFKHEGLGEGAAKNKAATYFMIGSPVPGESPSRSVNAGVSAGSSRKVAKPKEPTPSQAKPSSGVTHTDSIPLNVNVQIHIGADASSEQIEAIFSAMRRYLYDKQAS